MKRIIILNGFTGIFLLCSMSVSAKISEGKPVCSLSREHISFMQMSPDTIPSAVRPAEATSSKPVTEKPVASIIKEVPKARKVAVPKPVTVKVKPVKVIKPKVIKPVIKLL